MVDLDREQDIEELRQIAHAQQAQIRILLDALAIKSKEIDTLKGKQGDVQLTLKMLEALQAKATAADEALAKAEAAQKAKQKLERKPRTSTGPTGQPNLPIIEQEFVLDEADRVCPSCGGGLSAMKDQYDESEMIDVVEVSYRLVKVKQQKYVCRCGSCVETALGPERALPSQTLWDLAYAVAQRLSLVDAALMKHLLEQPVIGLDQTSWPRLETDATKPWQMWALTAPGVVVHRIHGDKSAATFGALVGDDIDVRAELRRTKASAILDDLKAWLWTRGPVVGRKNHYGSKSRRGTEVASRLYTILGAAHDGSWRGLTGERTWMTRSRRGVCDRTPT